MRKKMIKENEKKVLDINDLIMQIKNITKDGIVSTSKERRLFGYVKVNFENGSEVLTEVFETIKH